MNFLPLIGSLISGGMSLFGQSQQQASQEKINAQNIAMQKEFAQHGISWRAQDATNVERDLGINRLSALGVQPGPGFSNIVGSTENALGAAGQDIGRAVAAMADGNTRREQLEEKLLEARIKGLEADTATTQLRNSKIATTLTGAPPTPYNWQVGGPGDPRGPGKGRPNMWTEYWDNVAGKVGGVFPSAELSQANQAAFALGGAPGLGALMLRYQMFPKPSEGSTGFVAPGATPGGSTWDFNPY